MNGSLSSARAVLEVERHSSAESRAAPGRGGDIERGNGAEEHRRSRHGHRDKGEAMGERVTVDTERSSIIIIMGCFKGSQGRCKGTAGSLWE